MKAGDSVIISGRREIVELSTCGEFGMSGEYAILGKMEGKLLNYVDHPFYGWNVFIEIEDDNRTLYYIVFVEGAEIGTP